MPKLFFQRPDELLLGQETAAAALARFPAAVQRVMDMHPEGNVAIVTHGTVLALYLAELSDEAPFALWRQMRLPSSAMVPWPADGGTEVVAQLTWWRGESGCGSVHRGGDHGKNFVANLTSNGQCVGGFLVRRPEVAVISQLHRAVSQQEYFRARQIERGFDRCQDSRRSPQIMGSLYGVAMQLQNCLDQFLDRLLTMETPGVVRPSASNASGRFRQMAVGLSQPTADQVCFRLHRGPGLRAG